jgi:hypothetical protein
MTGGRAEEPAEAGSEPMAEPAGKTLRPMEQGDGGEDTALRQKEDALLTLNEPYEKQSPAAMGFVELDAIYGPETPIGKAAAEVMALRAQQPAAEPGKMNFEADDPERARQHQIEMILERAKASADRAEYRAKQPLSDAA